MALVGELIEVGIRNIERMFFAVLSVLLFVL